MSQFGEYFSRGCPVIGMLHAPPLAGSPGYGGDFADIRQRVLSDAAALAEGGVDGFMLENYGDVPFFPDRVPAATVAMLTALAAAVKAEHRLPLGINVLRNDGRGALAIAAAVGAQFIRVNVLCGARLTDQGIVAGIAHDLLRERAALRAQSIAILADVDVKHSAPLAARPLAEEAQDLVQRGLADALIVSGAATALPTDPRDVVLVRQAVPGTPVLVGSGIHANNAAQFLPCEGLIVGSGLKEGGRATAAVDRHRVRQLMEALAAAESA